MIIEIITIFCICNGYLKSIDYKDNKQATMSTNKILTTTFDLPKGSKTHADRGYTDYGFEDHLEFTKQIHLLVRKKENAKRPDHGMCKKIRRQAESSFSFIVFNFARKITLQPFLVLSLK